MGRPKKFCREDVLKKAMPVFWSKGFADTAMQDLEKATGVNKSGLYSEFKDKEDLFVESLRFYFSSNNSSELLIKEPLGWANIELFLKFLIQRPSTQKGCFGVNSMRDADQLPEGACELLSGNRAQLKKLFLKNIAAEKTKMPPEAISEILSTFFSGFCIEQNIKNSKTAMMAKVDDLMKTLRTM